MSSTEKSLQLKDEGNALFAKQKFTQAYKKYSAAILEDGNNAVFYANRAACSLAMKKHFDAVNDATKATELDPTYSKAWARLATGSQAIGSWNRAVEAWKRALASLPVENLSAGELKQKEQYQSDLKAAQDRMDYLAERNGEHLHVLPANGPQSGNLPWERAKAMYPELQRQRMASVASSAWVIYTAYEEFSEGVKYMKQLKEVSTPSGQKMIVGHTGAIVCITNGILRDKRVFHMDDPKWIDSYNKQVCFEAQKHNAWTEAGPERVLQESQARLRVKNWNDVRPALSVTVRAWLMRALLSSGASQDYGVAIQWYNQCIEVLERGQKIWHGVHKDDRGAIFEDTFVRAIRSLLLSELMKAYAANPGPDSQYPLAKTLELADSIIAECQRNPPSTSNEYDPGFLSSFYVYPVAEAFAIKGFCHRQMAQFECNDPEDIKRHLAKSVAFYLDAALKFPDDDEQHYWYLNSALFSMWRTGTPPRITLPLIARIREGIPKMKKIWEHSSLVQDGRDSILQQTLEFEEDVLKAIQEGTITEDDLIVPENHSNPKK